MTNQHTTLWDIFFAHAVQGLLAATTAECKSDVDELVRYAAQIADKMVHARDRAMQASASATVSDD